MLFEPAMGIQRVSCIQRPAAGTVHIVWSSKSPWRVHSELVFYVLTDLGCSHRSFCPIMRLPVLIREISGFCTYANCTSVYGMYKHCSDECITRVMCLWAVIEKVYFKFVDRLEADGSWLWIRDNMFPMAITRVSSWQISIVQYNISVLQTMSTLLRLWPLSRRAITNPCISSLTGWYTYYN